MEADRNFLVKKIEQIQRKIGFDDTFSEAAMFHTRQLYEDHRSSRSESCILLMSKLFIDRMEYIYSPNRFKSQVDEESKWPVKPIPIECFGDTKTPDTYRLNCFYECLKVSDILDCRVVTVHPDKYDLRVIHKYGVTAILDDLNIMVIMDKSNSDMQILKKDLLPCELIRVKVSKIIKKDEKIVEIHGIINEEEQKGEGVKKLGRLSEDCLPPYVLNPHVVEMFSSYSKYLNHMPQFTNPILLNEIYTDFGIDLCKMYSFNPRFDRRKSDEFKTGQALLNEQKLQESQKHAYAALKSYKEKNLSLSLSYISKAIDMCPVQDELSNLYDIRATIYKDSTNPDKKLSMKAVLDWVKAYSLNPKNEDIKKNISSYMFVIANKFYVINDYKMAFIYAEKALKLDKNNVQADKLEKYLKKKHPEIFLDEESLVALQEKQKELVSELEKFEAKKEKK